MTMKKIVVITTICLIGLVIGQGIIGQNVEAQLAAIGTATGIAGTAMAASYLGLGGASALGFVVLTLLGGVPIIGAIILAIGGVVAGAGLTGIFLTICGLISAPIIFIIGIGLSALGIGAGGTLLALVGGIPFIGVIFAAVASIIGFLISIPFLGWLFNTFLGLVSIPVAMFLTFILGGGLNGVINIFLMGIQSLFMAIPFVGALILPIIQILMIISKGILVPIGDIVGLIPIVGSWLASRIIGTGAVI